MVKLKHSENKRLTLLLDMEDGYPLDFSNKTLAEFFQDEFSEDIYSEQYEINGTSKANRIRAFLELSPPRKAGKLLRALLKRKNSDRDRAYRQKQQMVASGFADVEELELDNLTSAEEDRDFLELIEEIESRSHNEITSAASILAKQFNFDTVYQELERAQNFVDDDPEDAITAACSLVESVCRSILVELKLPLPSELSITPLYKAVREPLGLAPGKETIEPQIADDVRTILAGITNSIKGIGALRTHAGDAHGRERGRTRVDARIARLSVNSASAVSIFLIETWALKYPNRPLPNVTRER